MIEMATDGCLIRAFDGSRERMLWLEIYPVYQEMDRPLYIPVTILRAAILATYSREPPMTMWRIDKLGIGRPGERMTVMLGLLFLKSKKLGEAHSPNQNWPVVSRSAERPFRMS